MLRPVTQVAKNGLREQCESRFHAALAAHLTHHRISLHKFDNPLQVTFTVNTHMCAAALTAGALCTNCRFSLHLPHTICMKGRVSFISKLIPTWVLQCRMHACMLFTVSCYYCCSLKQSAKLSYTSIPVQSNYIAFIIFNI